MRLVDQGRLSLDEGVNRYLKRWQLESAEIDPERVTARRLLSHTAGLTVRGYTDYGPGRRLPALDAILDGANQLDWSGGACLGAGDALLLLRGGFAVLQMVIEDITGLPFDVYMRQEITGPLGLESIRWGWSPEMVATAPVPYAYQGAALEHRTLAVAAAGGGLGTVGDFAAFVAAALPGPNGSPAGRGVLRPETVSRMLEAQPATEGGEGWATVLP